MSSTAGSPATASDASTRRTSLRTVGRLTSAEWGALALAAPLVLGVRVALSLLPSATIVRGTRRLSARALGARTRGSATLLVWAVEASARRIPRATCLTQAIAALLLLRAYGQAAELCLGVGRDDLGRFRAHAWLERDGRVLIGGGELHALTRLPDLADSLRRPGSIAT